MLVVKITNHVQAALDRLLNQYKRVNPQYFLKLNSDGSTIQVSGFQALIAVLANECQNLENAIYSLDEGRQFYNGTIFPAVGAQLDGIGQLVGVERNGLDDATYLIFIIATIAENFSQTTIADVINVATLLFQKTSFLAFEMFPAEYDLQIPSSSPLSPALFTLVANIIHATLGAGIGLGFITFYDEDDSFQFSDLDETQHATGGFGDLNDPSIGGQFAYNIFSNPGA